MGSSRGESGKKESDPTMNEAITFGLQALVTLVVILDPPGATPLFLSLTSSQSRKAQIRTAWLAAATSLAVISIFALFGQFIVNYLDISIPALQGAGGLLLLLISLELLKGNNEGRNREKNLALVPLGTPMLAGPGAIVTIMLFARKVETLSSGVALALAVFAAHIVIGLTLMFATRIVSLIKEAGVMLLAKIAGLLTAAIAFQMLMTGIKALIA